MKFKEQERAEILSELEPLFEKAEREGLWFHCSYQDLWFSPAQLRREHQAGSFVWGAVNWTLRDPAEKVAAAKRALDLAQHYYQSVRDEVAGA